MLTVDPEKVCYILVKAREFDAKIEPDDPESGSNPADDRSIDILEDFADDPTLQELTSAIDSLNDDERSELVALVWLGRGDYTEESWEEALVEASRLRQDQIAQYLIGTPLLSDYLEEGLSMLGISCQDYEIGRL